MKKTKKMPKQLKKAYKQVDSLPNDWFGNEKASFENLPSVSSKKDIVRTSTYLKKEDLQYLKTISKKTHVPVAQLTGEIVSLFIAKTKK